MTTDFDAHEAETPEQIQEWHDAAFAVYEAAYEDYVSDDVRDDDKLAAYEEARDYLTAGVKYWRQVGEQSGTRTGIAVEDNTEG